MRRFRPASRSEAHHGAAPGGAVDSRRPAPEQPEARPPRKLAQHARSASQLEIAARPPSTRSALQSRSTSQLEIAARPPSTRGVVQFSASTASLPAALAAEEGEAEGVVDGGTPELGSCRIGDTGEAVVEAVEAVEAVAEADAEADAEAVVEMEPPSHDAQVEPPPAAQAAEVRSPERPWAGVKVCVRVRPRSHAEISSDEPEVVSCIAEQGVVKMAPASPPLASRVTFSVAGSLASVSSSVGMGSGRLGSRRLRGSWAGAAPSMWEFDSVLPGNSSQAAVYRDMGDTVAADVIGGYHSCIMAYGETGSGKSHTMFGRSGEELGLIPRFAKDILGKLSQASADSTAAGAKADEFLLKMSYLELYNEQIRDLLRPSEAIWGGSSVARKQEGPPLEVRQHPRIGVFIGGLTSGVVKEVNDVTSMLDFGNQMRSVSSTDSNAASSRSHAVVTFFVERLFDKRDKEKDTRMRRWASLHLVDLAGSSRLQVSDGVSEVRLKERNRINTSLWALGLVIRRLAKDRCTSGSRSSGGHVPFRNSKLTYLLSDSLMGNSRTMMLACVSPTAASSSMTESTLRFATDARKVRTLPVLNEERAGEFALSLRREIEQLGKQLGRASAADRRRDLTERIQTAQLAEQQYATTWEEQHARSEALEVERRKALLRLGISRPGSAQVTPTPSRGVSASASAAEAGASSSEVAANAAPPFIGEKKRQRHGDATGEAATPAPSVTMSGHGSIAGRQEGVTLIRVSNDPQPGRLRYFIPKGRDGLRVGSDRSCAIRLNGLGVLPEMCHLSCSSDGSGLEVVLKPASQAPAAGSDRRPPKKPQSQKGIVRQGPLYKSTAPKVFVNDAPVDARSTVKSGDVLRFGHAHEFRMRPTSTQGTDGEDSGRRDPEGRVVRRPWEELQRCVDEANLITEELRSGSDGEAARRLVFKLHTSPHLRPDEEEDFESMAVALHDTTAVSSGPDGDALAVLPIDQFTERLEALRKVYRAVSQRETPWGEVGDLDPWQDCISGVAGIGHTVQERPPNPTPASATEASAGASASSLPPLSRSDGGEPDAEPANQQRTAKSAEQKALELAKEVAVARSRTSDLERANVEQAAWVADLTEQLARCRADMAATAAREAEDSPKANANLETELREELAKLQVALKQRDDVVNNLQAQLGDVPARLSDAQRRIDELQAEIAGSRSASTCASAVPGVICRPVVGTATAPMTRPVFSPAAVFPRRPLSRAASASALLFPPPSVASAHGRSALPSTRSSSPRSQAAATPALGLGPSVSSSARLPPGMGARRLAADAAEQSWSPKIAGGRQDAAPESSTHSGAASISLTPAPHGNAPGQVPSPTVHRWATVPVLKDLPPSGGRPSPAPAVLLTGGQVPLTFSPTGSGMASPVLTVRRSASWDRPLVSVASTAQATVRHAFPVVAATPLATPVHASYSPDVRRFETGGSVQEWRTPMAPPHMATTQNGPVVHHDVAPQTASAPCSFWPMAPPGVTPQGVALPGVDDGRSRVVVFDPAGVAGPHRGLGVRSRSLYFTAPAASRQTWAPRAVVRAAPAPVKVHLAPAATAAKPAMPAKPPGEVPMEPIVPAPGSPWPGVALRPSPA